MASVCPNCNGNGSNKGIGTPVVNPGGGTVNGAITGSNGLCSGCGGTGILRSCGV